MNTFKKYPILTSLAAAILFSLLLLLAVSWPYPVPAVIASPIFGVLFVYPLVLTVLNLVFCIRKDPSEAWRRAACRIEAVTMILGILFSLLLCCVTDIDFSAHWTATLVDSQLHSPVWTKAWPSVAACLVVGLFGYGILKRSSFRTMPPLLIVFSISAMYLGMGTCVLWVIQFFVTDRLEFYFCLLPLNWLLLCIRTIREKAADWKQIEETEMRSFQNPFLERLNRKVMDSCAWPLWTFLLLWPVLGLLLIILALLGQRPTDLIQAWTETSQWNLSTQVSPPNMVTDGHYLCTVAAGGHRRLVKPLRSGVRHGHLVVVNRQLCIANAFEQLLKERLPLVHRNVRNFYDRYGLPVSRLIRSPYAADAVYVVMKPLEWFFLLILYLTDARPEDRIRMQYIPPVPEGFSPSRPEHAITGPEKQS